MQMSSSQCQQIRAGGEGHTWPRATYNLCERARRETPCNNIQDENQRYQDTATPRNSPCPVCGLIEEARTEYQAKVEAASEYWSAVYVSIV